MIIDEINKELATRKPFLIEYDSVFYNPIYDEIKKGAGFINLLTRLINNYIGIKCDKRTLISMNYEIDKTMKYYFDISSISHPGWEAECMFGIYNHRIIHPNLKTVSGELISIIEAQERIDKFGYTLKFYEEAKLEKKEVCYTISR